MHLDSERYCGMLKEGERGSLHPKYEPPRSRSISPPSFPHTHTTSIRAVGFPLQGVAVDVEDRIRQLTRNREDWNLARSLRQAQHQRGEEVEEVEIEGRREKGLRVEGGSADSTLGPAHFPPASTLQTAASVHSPLTSPDVDTSADHRQVSGDDGSSGEDHDDATLRLFPSVPALTRPPVRRLFSQ